MRSRSPAIVLAIIVALVGVVALLAWSPAVFSARGRSAQVFIFADDQRSDTTTLLLNVSEALPLLQGYRDQRMTCDGAAFTYGAPPWQTLVGYYGDLHTRPPGQSYHCVFHDWQGEVALDIPVVAAPSFPRFMAPAQGAHLSRSEAINVRLLFPPSAPEGGAPAMTLQARDAHAHYWWDESYGAGGYQGHAAFNPVAGRGFIAGSGALVAQYEIDNAYPVVPGWRSMQFLYRPATVLPVIWV
jgi:hypothetical protein